MNKKILTAVVAVGLAASTCGMLFFNQHKKEQELQKTVVYIEGAPVSALEYQYYYLQQKQDFELTYADNIEALKIDTSVDYHLQSINTNYEEKSWGQVIDKMTCSAINEISSLYTRAMQDGYDKDRAEGYYNSRIQGFKDMARKNGITLDEYLSGTYLSNCSLKSIEDIVRRESIAKAYRDELAGRIGVTDEEIEAYYQEHRDEYDSVTYREFGIDIGDFFVQDGGDDADVTLLNEEKAKKEALAAAEEFASGITDEESYKEACYEYIQNNEDLAINLEAYKKRDTSLISNVTKEQLREEAAEWLFDPARTPGEIGIVFVDAVDKYNVIYFMGRQRTSNKKVDVRVIYIPYETSYVYGYAVTEETKEQAREKVSDIIKEFEIDKTEEHFASLAKQYSKDIISKDSGGLFSNINEYTMPLNTSQWAFEKGRINGDYTSIEDDSGIRIVYYISSNDDSYWESAIESKLLTDKILAFLDAPETENLEVEWVKK